MAECWVSRVASCWQRGAISTADTDEADFRLPASEDRLWVDSCLIGGFVMNGSYLWSTARKLTGGKRPNLCHLIGLSTGFHTTGVAVSNLLSFDRPLIA